LRLASNALDVSGNQNQRRPHVCLLCARGRSVAPGAAKSALPQEPLSGGNEWSGWKSYGMGRERWEKPKNLSCSPSLTGHKLSNKLSQGIAEAREAKKSWQEADGETGLDGKARSLSIGIYQPIKTPQAASGAT